MGATKRAALKAEFEPESEDQPPAGSGGAAQRNPKRRSCGELALDVEPCADEAPMSLGELLKWAPRCLRRLPAKMLQELASNISSGVMMLEDYAGWGTMSAAASHIEQAVRDKCMLRDGLGFKVGRAADIEEHCRRAMLSHKGSSAPACVFGDMLQRTPAKLLDRMKAVLETVEARVNKLVSDGTAERVAITVVSKDVSHEVAKSMVTREKADNFDYTTRCFRHGDRGGCRVLPLPRSQDELRGQTVGFACLDWSVIGLKKGWCGQSTMCVMQWLRDLFRDMPHFAIGERTSSFDSDALAEVISPEYEMHVLMIRPIDLGYPCRRPRKFMLMINREKLAWMPEVSQEGVGLSFKNFFHERCVTLGDLHFRAPCDLVNKMLAFRAAQRGLPTARLNGKPWRGRHVLGPGRAANLEGYEKMAVRKGLGRKPSMIVNLAQRPGFMFLSRMIPTLLRKSDLWSMRHGREMLAEEVVEVQGMSLFSQDDGFQCPFKDAVLSGKFSPRELRSMAGNAMHLGVAGSCMVFLLSCTTVVV